MRVILMMLCFAGAGWNIWIISEGSGGVLNYVATVMALGSGAYSMASLVRDP
jgi:hypothetical protein